MKELISKNFLEAYKAGDLIKKNCLASVKTAISKWETAKENIGKTISDGDIIKIISKEANKRKDAIELYIQEGSTKALNNATKESKELEILENYLPAQISSYDLKEKVKEFVIKDNQFVAGDHKAARSMFGLIMKEFNSKYKGQYDPILLKNITEEYLQII